MAGQRKEPWKKRAGKMFDKGLRIGAEMSELMVHLKARPTALSAVTVGAKAYQVVRDATAVSPQEYFRSWSRLNSPFEEFLFRLVNASCEGTTIRKPYGENSSVGYVAEMYGGEFGWIAYQSHTQGIYYRGIDTEIEAKANLARYIYEQLGRNLVLRAHPILPAEIASDRLTESLSSPTSERIADRILKFRKHGIARSILLYGEPGTGKTYILRDVARRVGGLSFRVKVDDLKYTASLPDILDFMQPDAVLIDDFERLDGANHVLAEFEVMRSTTKLIMVTVNDPNKLDRALLRPERFDEVIELQKLDPEVIDAMLEGVPAVAADVLRDMPIVYISEFRKLSTVLGMEEALTQVEMLQARMKKIQSMAKKGKGGADEQADEAVRLMQTGERVERSG